MVGKPAIGLDLCRWLENLLLVWTCVDGWKTFLCKSSGALVAPVFLIIRRICIPDSVRQYSWSRGCSPAPHFWFVAPFIVLMRGNFHFLTKTLIIPLFSHYFSLFFFIFLSLRKLEWLGRLILIELVTYFQSAWSSSLQNDSNRWLTHAIIIALVINQIHQIFQRVKTGKKGD